jgi:hypothetical protein
MPLLLDLLFKGTEREALHETWFYEPASHAAESQSQAQDYLQRLRHAAGPKCWTKHAGMTAVPLRQY